MKEIENEKIFDLLAEKSYQDLGNLEKAIVDKELNEQEYEDFREVVSDFKLVDAVLEFKKPKPITENKGKHNDWWSYRMPSYQVAAVFVIAVVSTFLLTKNTINQPLPVVETNGLELDTLVGFKKSINMVSEEYPSAFVINW